MYIITILILVGIITILEKKIGNIKKEEQEEQIEDVVNNYCDNFEKVDYLLTATELKFYKILKRITDKLGYSLFCQVALYEIVKNKDYKDFNKIKSKSIDFVITEPNCKIKLCVELDDKTHNNVKRAERDDFINKLFKDLNIKLIRIPVQNFYNMEELEQKIKECL